VWIKINKHADLTNTGSQGRISSTTMGFQSADIKCGLSPKIWLDQPFLRHAVLTSDTISVDHTGK
jgi:hypothetical protein